MIVTPLTLVSYRPDGGDPRSISSLISNFDHIVNEVNNQIIPAINAVGEQAFQDFLTPGVVGAASCGFTRDSSAQVTISSGTVWATAGGVLKRFTVSSTVLSGIPTATNTRFDIIVFDTSDGLVKRLSGTDQTGVTLANRLGAPAVAGTQQELWNLLIGVGGLGSTIDTDYRDRRLPHNGEIRGWTAALAMGATSRGFGWKASGVAAGQYGLSFNRTLPREPTVVLSGKDPGGLNGLMVTSAGADATGFTIYIADAADNLISQRVSFIASYRPV